MKASSYEVVRTIGNGQEGRIFLAQRDGHFYALKELLGAASDGEAVMLSSINHPGVIGFHKVLQGEAITIVL